MPSFHHSVAVLPLPFRRSAVVKFRCFVNKKAQLSLTNPRDACEKFARFT